MPEFYEIKQFSLVSLLGHLPNIKKGTDAIARYHLFATTGQHCFFLFMDFQIYQHFLVISLKNLQKD